MTTCKGRPRLTTDDVNLIPQVLHWAHHHGVSVAEAVQDLLSDNEYELRSLRHEIRSGPRDHTAELMQEMCDRLEEERRCIRRLMRMFASWRKTESVGPDMRPA